MSGIGRIGAPPRVPGQNGFDNQDSFKAEWSTLIVQPNRPVELSAIAVKPLAANAGNTVSIKVYQEIRGGKQYVGNEMRVPLVNGKATAKWIPTMLGNFHFEVRLGTHYGRTRNLLSVTNQNSPQSNYYKDSFQR